MRIAIIADTHAGARNDSPQFDAQFRKFFDDVFFPYLIEHKIDTIIHLGDIFDRRKYINFQTLHSVRTYFFERLRELNIHMFVVAGNHDTFFKNTNAVNSLQLLLGEYNNYMTIVDQTPRKYEFDGRMFTFIPWVTNDNYAECAEEMERGGDVCIGHFEFDGYQMFQGIRNEGGMNRKMVEGFNWVFTGHFHTRSAEDNIYYLGSPYEFVWSDFEDPRGFHTFDTETNDLVFIENPNRMFHKIYYDDTLPLPLADRFRGCCVKVVVVKKTDATKFESFIDALYQQDVAELTIHEDLAEFTGHHVSDDDLNLEDTISLLDGFVDATETDRDRNRLKTLLKSVYVEAQDVEV